MGRAACLTTETTSAAGSHSVSPLCASLPGLRSQQPRAPNPEGNDATRPEVAEDFKARQAAGEFDYVIAVDAGFAHLEAIGAVPDMAVGDFDSLGYVPKCRRVSRHPVKKDKSDMELAMEKALSWGHDELIVYGALGARLDHTLANLQLFAKFSERDVYVTAVADTYAVRLLTGPDVFELPALGGGTVSVFSANDMARGVIERGMEYSIDDEPLSNRTSRGLSNELTGEEATVAVEEGTLYVFYPLA